MIIHVDMDAFYASVEQRDDPRLVGRPVIVGGSPQGRGVVSAASYEARALGVHSAMPAALAGRLCPDAVFIRPRMKHYASISRHLRRILFRYSSLVEPIALDEAFLDVSGCQRLFGSAEQIGKKIKRSVREELGITASAGVAPNKFLAKLASGLHKPDGMVSVDVDRVQSFLDPLPIRRVWGIGERAENKFAALGVATIGQLRTVSVGVLRQVFGTNGDHFWRLARGQDSRKVVPDQLARSISHETTFAADIGDRPALRARVMELTDQVAMRLRRHGLRTRTVQLKIRFDDFETITRARTIGEPTNATSVMCTATVDILEQVLQEFEKPLRLLGVAATNLLQSPWVQLDLFDQAHRARFQRLDRTTDDIRARFGLGAVRSGLAVEHRLQRDPAENQQDNSED